MKPILHRRALLNASLGLCAWPLLGTAQAQTKESYPVKPVRVVIGLPAGGVADNTMRVLTSQMQPAFGQPFVIDNKPGGSFAIAMNAMTQAPADGYTLMHVTNMMLAAQAVLKRYDMLKALVPIATLGASDMALAVGGKGPYKTVKELIEFGRAHPGKLTYAVPGIGTLEHLTLAAFCNRNGIKAVSVPFKGGPEVVQAIAAGECDFCVTPVPFLVQFESKGLLRGLVLLNEQRNAALPALPTYREAGVDVPRLVLWGALAAPVGTPAAVIATLEKQALAANVMPDVRRQLLAMGLDPSFSGGAEFTAKLWAEDWAWIAKSASDVPVDKN